MRGLKGLGDGASNVVALSEGGELSLSIIGDDGIEVRASARLLDGRCWAAPALAGTTLVVRDTERILAVDLAVRAAP